MKKSIGINKEWSFERGYSQVQNRYLKIVKREIEDALGLNNRNTFYYRKRGDIIPRADEIRKIESVFHKYGITKIWGAE